MFKRTLVVAIALSGFTTMALAQVQLPPNDPNNGPTDPCMMKAYELADAAGKKDLSDASLQKLDGMFDLMEKHCKALELPQAQAAAAEIKTFIDTAK